VLPQSVNTRKFSNKNKNILIIGREAYDTEMERKDFRLAFSYPF
jgi:hypothetical protein